MATEIFGNAYENRHWEDTGCEVSSTCLECPLSACRWDDPAEYNRLRRRQADSAIIHEMQRLGMSVEETAAKYGKTVRTIFRIKERVVKEGYIA